mmetsp:Transcript_46605/g.109603  ORF Transcript_46605/g.109603 Transcript_46605/m.109603 type:complete len:811 (-) Transcript_46605:274-2706(-)
MAEAAAGARLDAAFDHVRRDVNLVTTEDGAYAVTLSFVPSEMLNSAYRRLFRVKKIIQNMIWPLTPLIWGIIVTAVCVRVVTAESGSWWRSGWLAEFLWGIDEMFPWEKHLPTQLRVAWLSLVAALVGLVIISFVQRSILKYLLTFNGYMWISGKPPLHWKAYFGLVQVLSGAKPSLYNFQNLLPSLPVPPLKETCDKFLLSVKALVSKERYAELEKKCEEFQKKSGWRIQLYLLWRRMTTNSWLWEWWEKYVYLKVSKPIMINSNYYILDQFKYLPTKVQAARAAGMIWEVEDFKLKIDWEQLDPVRNSGIPWCMKQYERLFDTTRIPGAEYDELKHYDHSPERYIAVERRGVWYKLPLMVKGQKGWRRAFPHEIEVQMAKIIEDADKNPAPAGENALAALTGWKRDGWAQARKTFFWAEPNRSSLEIVEKASMHMHLETRAPSDLTEQAKMLINNDGKSLWFDKSLSFVAFANGKGGLNAEHSYADALTTAHMWEWLMSGEAVVDDLYRPDDGHCKGFKDAAYEQVELPAPQRLSWDMKVKSDGGDSTLLKVVNNAWEQNKQEIEDLDLKVMCFEDWGKGFIKQAKMSPDAFMQAAMQLAYRMDSDGRNALVYEASVTRLFKQGRTETVRALSVESQAFVDAMLDEKQTDEERVKRLRKSASKHATLYKEAMAGKGIDRHLFGLYIASIGLAKLGVVDEMKEGDFLREALAMPWTLSTSQTPQNQTPTRWKPNSEHKHMVSPGGGFGPVDDGGYGVSYMFPNDDIIFAHISSKKSSDSTDSSRFKGNIAKALNMIKASIEEDFKSKGK